jgi:uncharacterized protein YlxW (UPF0749 family)
MATWIIPALKAVLPHIGTIVSATAPAFTQKRADATPDQTQLLQQQISELQTAAAQNAAHVKELAEQLQRTVAAIEQAALVGKANQLRVLLLSIGAMMISIISLGIVFFRGYIF